MIDDLRDRLEQTLSRQDRALLRLVGRAARALRLPLYAVGGMPRDLVMGRSPRDLDLVVEGDAVELARALAQAHGGLVTAHPRFGTATWTRKAAGGRARSPHSGAWTRSLDLITARAEIYPHPAQLPQVRPGPIADDLGRRDFTINAIAVRLDGRHFGRVLDPLGGIVDLRSKRVRALHDRSFIDDPTRMYRAVRYEQRLGFRISRETRTLMHAGGRWVGAVSGQRLRHELDLILGETRRAAMLRRLLGLGLLHKVNPFLPADARCLGRIASISASQAADRSRGTDASLRFTLWTMWLMDLRPAALRAVGRRLAFTRKEQESILAAAALYQTADRWVHWRPSKLTLKLDRIPEASIEAVRVALPAGRARHALHDYLRSWRHLRARTTGSDLRARGLKPGPRYRSILQALRAAWIDGAVKDTQGERMLLDRLMGRAIAGPGRISAKLSTRSSA